ncbi:MAG: sulfotransferase domain-containing protein [Rhodothermales bacterium]
MFPHSLVDLDSVERHFTAIHLVRDPRDVIVSGYLYHKRCNEPWCRNTDFDWSDPLNYPIVPRSQDHRPLEWKKNYLNSLNGRSYQENLRSLAQEDGLLFEMDHYASWTIRQMESWDYSRPDTLELKFEDIMTDFEASFASMFAHVGFNKIQTDFASSVAITEDISRMTDKEIMMNNHISARSTSKWSRYFTPKLKDEFKARFPDTLQRLGYETSTDW